MNLFSGSILQYKYAHVGWIIFILTVSLIISISFDFGANEEISNIISFAVSLTSLFLAVVAIAYALLASYRDVEATRHMHAAVSAVAEPAARLNATAGELQSLLLHIRNQNETIADSFQKFQSGPSAERVEVLSLNITDDSIKLASKNNKVVLYAALQCIQKNMLFDVYAIHNEHRRAGIMAGLSALTWVGLIYADFSGRYISITGSPTFKAVIDRSAYLWWSSYTGNDDDLVPQLQAIDRALVPKDQEHSTASG